MNTEIKETEELKKKIAELERQNNDLKIKLSMADARVERLEIVVTQLQNRLANARRASY